MEGLVDGGGTALLEADWAVDASILAKGQHNQRGNLIVGELRCTIASCSILTCILKVLCCITKPVVLSLHCCNALASLPNVTICCCRSWG